MPPKAEKNSKHERVVSFYNAVPPPNELCRSGTAAVAERRSERRNLEHVGAMHRRGVSGSTQGDQ